MLARSSLTEKGDGGPWSRRKDGERGRKDRQNRAEEIDAGEWLERERADRKRGWKRIDHAQLDLFSSRNDMQMEETRMPTFVTI